MTTRASTARIGEILRRIQVHYAGTLDAGPFFWPLPLTGNVKIEKLGYLQRQKRVVGLGRRSRRRMGSRGISEAGLGWTRTEFPEGHTSITPEREVRSSGPMRRPGGIRPEMPENFSSTSADYNFILNSSRASRLLMLHPRFARRRRRLRDHAGETAEEKLPPRRQSRSLGQCYTRFKACSAIHLEVTPCVRSRHFVRHHRFDS